MTGILDDERSLLWIAAILYSVGFFTSLASLAKGWRYPRWRLLALVGTGFVFQSLGLYGRGLEAGGCPIGNPFEILQFIAWSATLIYLAIGPAFRMSLLGFFCSGTTAFLGVLSLLVRSWDYARDARIFGNNPWVETHAAFAIFSYGVFTIMALTSAMYLTQNFGLQNKRSHGLFPFLPSLVELDLMNARLLFTGVGVFTFAMTVGMVNWLEDLQSVHTLKLLFAFGLWFTCLGVFVLRLTKMLLAKRFAWSCLVIFILAMITLWPVGANH